MIILSLVILQEELDHLTKLDNNYRISLGKKFSELLGAKPGDRIIIKVKEHDVIIRRAEVIDRILEGMDKK